MGHLRRVIVKYTSRKDNLGYFHRFVYMQNNYETVTKALIEMDSGDLELYDLRSVKFIDKPNKNSSEKLP
ncbi:hypothetical protein GCM10027429_02990 [Marivirga atlantica]|uniref:Uncharacterized protein n=1 Tax=Marivirga atlantica TaxID=1548457 RepID=A0A937DI90_9BACT|nr:hypothetical protein [Marivirga atlantica]MBL0763911.1 hypothetical protein [Marivirga atlantica]